ncbi:hypothetical protein ACWCP9_39560 [Streptomyces eurythermus]
MNKVTNSAVTSAATPPGPWECTVLTDNTVPVADLLPPQSAADTSEAVTARPAMVARLKENGALGPGPVREALLALPPESLMPTQRSLRQQLCPPGLQSRAQQTSVWLVTDVRPAAALTAGGIAAVFSVHAALLVGTVLYLVPAGLLCSSPVRRLTTMPTHTPTLAAAKDDVHEH